jgi:alpha-D-ribose 1-methylphosphonate 5-triphosphate synthase subunit PhnH
MTVLQMDASQRHLSAGFADPVHDAQRAFRAALAALARPGHVVDVGQAIGGLGLGAAMAHLLLALTDDDTPVWWQQAGAAHSQWLRFHTGAQLARTTGEAMFAVVADALSMPPLDDFAPGTAASPESSATLLVEVPSLDQGPALQWGGPGIREAGSVRVAGLPPAFWSQWQANHAAFPQGVDVIFTCGAQALGLPRTTRVGRLEGI